jgi:hypothetical protein
MHSSVSFDKVLDKDEYKFLSEIPAKERSRVLKALIRHSTQKCDIRFMYIPIQKSICAKTSPVNNIISDDDTQTFSQSPPSGPDESHSDAATAVTNDKQHYNQNNSYHNKNSNPENKQNSQNRQSNKPISNKNNESGKPSLVQYPTPTNNTRKTPSSSTNDMMSLI